MAQKTWILTDVDSDVFVEELTIGPGNVGGSAQGYSVNKRTLRGGLRDGVETIEVDNGTFRFVVLPTRGMGIWRGWVDDLYVGWQSPLKGPVHPKFVPIAEPSGMGWLDGFDELFVRCGLESNGAPDFDSSGKLLYPVHGRIANLPAHRVEVSVDGETGKISVTGIVDESRFHLQKLRMTSTISTSVGQPGFTVEDKVTNISGNPAQMQMLYHINFGTPFLDPGSKVVLPAETVVPRDPRAAEGIDHWEIYQQPQAGDSEQVYYCKLRGDEKNETQTLLKNAAGTQGFSLFFNTDELPCFTVWKNAPLAADGYVTGLEPGTNYPNTRTFETDQGRVVALEPGQTVRMNVRLEVHTDAESVAQAEAAVSRLQGGATPQVFNTPQPGWSAG